MKNQHLIRRSYSALRPFLFVAFAALSLTPLATPGLALGMGAALGLLLGNPFPRASERGAKLILQGCVVGLGFGMPLAAVARAGAAGIGYTIAGIAVAITLGLLLGRWIGVGREASILITAGTSICGGSAIAAVGPAIGARAESMSISLATVFLLNAVALYIFPPIGQLLGLSQDQFALWSAIAIHDTSSVVGAAAVYGPEALQQATILKLARALWIVPLTLAAAWYAGARTRPVVASASGVAATASPEATRAKVKLPWFIGPFLLAALARTLLPAGAAPLLDGMAQAARVGLVLALFLIGAGLTRGTLRAVGARPLAQGILLWILIAGLTLLAVWWW
jgi:uncharacterized integral membrane protein (TIGR00698 family)